VVSDSPCVARFNKSTSLVVTMFMSSVFACFQGLSIKRKKKKLLVIYSLSSLYRLSLWCFTWDFLGHGQHIPTDVTSDACPPRITIHNSDSKSDSITMGDLTTESLRSIIALYSMVRILVALYNKIIREVPYDKALVLL